MKTLIYLKDAACLLFIWYTWGFNAFLFSILIAFVNWYAFKLIWGIECDRINREVEKEIDRRVNDRIRGN
jgi:hypothetical protein